MHDASASATTSMHLWLCFVSTVFASAIKGRVSGLTEDDVPHTKVNLRDLVTGHTWSEPVLVSGNYEISNVPDGDYFLTLTSKSLQLPSNYKLLVRHGFGIQGVKCSRDSPQSCLLKPVEYNLALESVDLDPERVEMVKPRPKPRLFAIFTAPSVLIALAALGLVAIMPKLLADVDEEQLKMLQESMNNGGDVRAAFETAKKLADANTSQNDNEKPTKPARSSKSKKR